MHPSEKALSAIRIAIAVLLIIHGVARIWLGIVDDFGGFLDATGFPMGVVLAWFLTVMELVGGALLLAGRWARELSVYFAVQLAVGIVLVHASEGWFVVGAGRNGVEYSVLLIVGLLAVAYAEQSKA